ncbi:MAG: V-type ATP synthase subunit K [Planctomycetes bacterium]|nr:V-type ATP synthase subunit K [Planctomycetota bacterium]
MITTIFGQIGVVMVVGLGAVGSTLGIVWAGMAAAGSWAKDARSGKRLNFMYLLFVGAPLSQTLYAMIAMVAMSEFLKPEHSAALAANGGLLLGIGLATGLGELSSAWVQGMIGAAACRCLADSEGKGLAFLIIAIGIAETIGIFTLIFMLSMIPKP